MWVDVFFWNTVYMKRKFYWSYVILLCVAKTWKCFRTSVANLVLLKHWYKLCWNLFTTVICINMFLWSLHMCLNSMNLLVDYGINWCFTKCIRLQNLVEADVWFDLTNVSCCFCQCVCRVHWRTNVDTSWCSGRGCRFLTRVISCIVSSITVYVCL